MLNRRFRLIRRITEANSQTIEQDLDERMRSAGENRPFAVVLVLFTIHNTNMAIVFERGVACVGSCPAANRRREHQGAA